MGPVPQTSIIFIGLASIAGLLIPVALFLYFKLKKKADVMPFVLGCLIFFVFVVILESGINAAVFASPAGETMNNNRVLYALYGGIMAALFEEVGRFLALKHIRKKKGPKDANSLMYGAGHGGIEAFLVLGVSMFGNLTYAAAVNSGRIEELMSQLSGDALVQFTNSIELLVNTPGPTYLLSIAERIFAVAVQIALSVLVWTAVSRKGKGLFFPLAICIHAVFDFLSVMIAGLGIPMIAVEAIIGVMAVVICAFARAVWRKEDLGDVEEKTAAVYAGPRLGR